MKRSKIEIVSYSPQSSKSVLRKCPECKKKEEAELVDYGEVWQVLFFKCGTIKRVERKGGGR